MKTQPSRLIVGRVEKTDFRRDGKHVDRQVPGLLLFCEKEINDYERHFPKTSQEFFLDKKTARNLIEMLQRELDKIEH